MAIKTTWTEVNQIIKEEFQRVMEKKKIQSRIQQINEELAHMEEEDASMMKDENLEEVEAGSEMKVRSHAWTGEEDGDTKWTPEFDHKGSALMEEDEIEIGEEEDDAEEEGSLADEFAELGAAIEAKIMAALGKIEHEATETPEEEEENDEDKEEEEFEEVEVEDEDGEEEGGESEEEAIDEYNEVVQDEEGSTTTTHSMNQQKESINESVSVKSKNYLNVLSEGLDAR